ncbi:hypothetical protein AVEN_255191-1 [Araneus ventricosus]|uniref:Uncharacterized protein n=1 Tax=Araneus ventricosus TaxID=182803 RepID=A0A4Y2BAI4_ARAVE|nr:hypothetical protein AVEN_255191-1 [Araneus ventricosus]
MTTDNDPIHSLDSEIESNTAIEYNPHETIDETPSVLEKQPSTISTTTDKTTVKQTKRKPISMDSERYRGCGGLVVSSRLRGRRVPGSKPDSTEEPPCKWVWCTLNPSGPNFLVWCGAEVRRGGASSSVVLVI